VNLAVRRTPKPHVTIKYLEPDFTELFRSGLRGLAPDGSQDTGFHGRELTRAAAVGDLALATGLRLQEFTHLLRWEIPALPPEPTGAAGAENLIHAAQAACSYSWMMPARRSRRRMLSRASWPGSVIGSGSGCSGRALEMPRWGRWPL
jgi:hypothetical protein